MNHLNAATERTLMPVQLACGHIVNGPDQTHYCSYLQLDHLLAIQPTPETARHADEHLFVIVHQVHELWFKQLRWDIPRLIAALQSDNITVATWLMQRAVAIAKQFTPTMRMLDTLAPADFYEFRAPLSPASGTESWQWHEVEILIGARDEAFRRQLEAELSPTTDEGLQTHVWTERLEELWEAPSVASAFEEMLARRGLTATDLYTAAPASNPHGDLMLLAETMLDFDSEFRLWRFAHARTAERTIGSNPGTGLTTGVKYLDYAAFRRLPFFPSLLEARMTLWEQRNKN
jgi:tryptophan 2,3-dioxygenase